MVEYAGPEMCAWLECLVKRLEVATPCYMSEMCTDGGETNPSVNQCIKESLEDYRCHLLEPENFESDLEQKCL